MKNKRKLFAAMGLCFTMLFSSASLQAATNKYECENMTLSGNYAGRIYSPFSGVALYANNDSCAVSGVKLDKTATTIKVRGCSNNGKTAAVTVKMNGYTMGTLYFTGTVPTVQTLTCTPYAGTYTIQLVVTSDNGQWDALVDYMEVSQNGSTTNNNTGSNGNVYLCFDDGPTNSTSATLVNRLKSAGKPKPNYVRLPYLESNGTIQQVCSNLGLKIVQPTVYSEDWSGASTWQIINSCSNVKAGGNTLMHDGYTTTSDAVPTIVANLKAKGYGFAQY